MSVIGLNLWINFQVLKSTYQQLKIHTAVQIRELNNQIMNYQASIVSKLYSEIRDRDQIINRLKKERASQCNNNHDASESEWGKEKVGSSGELQGGVDMRTMGERLKEVLEQNRQYENQFAALIEEMKTIKIYVEELKKVKSMKYIEENYDQDSPAKRLYLEEEHLLTKISSLNRLQQIKIPHLDTIREVTEAEDEPELYVPAHSYEQEQQFASLVNNCHITQSHSFQCTNEIQDITNVLFDNNSQEAKEPNIKSQCYETFEYSLSVLKNYCNTLPENQTEPDSFTLPSVEQLLAPSLRLKQIVNERHLIFHGGYTYTGNTVRMSKNQIKPMGFGQLYHESRLVYCGDWKNGVFDGWGRMYFSERSEIRSYNGKWKEGRAQGSGSIFFWNNDKFMGTLQESEIRGDGTYYRDNKVMRCGYWQKNRLVQPEG